MREKTKSILVAVVICKMTPYCIENKVTFFSLFLQFASMSIFNRIKIELY